MCDGVYMCARIHIQTYILRRLEMLDMTRGDGLRHESKHESHVCLHLRHKSKMIGDMN